jgi:hypothetical protein
MVFCDFSNNKILRGFCNAAIIQNSKYLQMQAAVEGGYRPCQSKKSIRVKYIVQSFHAFCGLQNASQGSPMKASCQRSKFVKIHII